MGEPRRIGAEQLLQGIAGHPCGGLVGADDSAIQRHDRRADGHVLVHRLETGFRCAQLFEGAFALVNVLDQGHKRCRLAQGIAHQREGQPHPEDLAALAHVAPLDAVIAALTRQHLGEAIHAHVGVGRIDVLAVVALPQFCLAVAGHLADGGVGGQGLTVQRQETHADGRAFERGAEARLQLPALGLALLQGVGHAVEGRRQVSHLAQPAHRCDACAQVAGLQALYRGHQIAQRAQKEPLAALPGQRQRDNQHQSQRPQLPQRPGAEKLQRQHRHDHQQRQHDQPAAHAVEKTADSRHLDDLRRGCSAGGRQVWMAWRSPPAIVTGGEKGV